MNKESETLEKLLSFAFVMGENMVGLTKGNYDEKTFIKKTYEYLQKYAISRKEQLALQQRLESIDNSSPSEALGDLEKMVNLAYQVDDEFELLDDDFGLYYDKVKKYISKAQEQEEDIIHYKGTIANLRRDNALLKELNVKYKRVLEIIKEKPRDSRIAIAYLSTSISPTYEDYCLIVKIDLLPKEEFDLLKELS